MESLVSLPLISKHVTLNNLEWPFYVKFCLYTSTLRRETVTLENNFYGVQTNKDRPTLSATKCLAGLSGDIRFMPIFAGVFWNGGIVGLQWDRVLTLFTAHRHSLIVFAVFSRFIGRNIQGGLK